MHFTSRRETLPALVYIHYSPVSTCAGLVEYYSRIRSTVYRCIKCVLLYYILARIVIVISCTHNIITEIGTCIHAHLYDVNARRWRVSPSHPLSPAESLHRTIIIVMYYIITLTWRRRFLIFILCKYVWRRIWPFICSMR